MHAAGIGNGHFVYGVSAAGNDISIEGGTVNAAGGEGGTACAIGHGANAGFYNIYVKPYLDAYYGANNPPSTALTKTSDNLQTTLGDASKAKYFHSEPTKYSITKGTMTNGTVTVNSTAIYNETVTVTPVPNAGYTIDKMYYNDGSQHEITPVNGVYSFTMPDKGVTVSATFKISTYAITCADCTNGSVSADKSIAAEGDTVTLSNTPGSGYVFDSYKVYKTGDESTTVTVTDGKFTMPAYPVTVSAAFTAIPEEVKNAGYYASLTLSENIDINFSIENLGSGFTLQNLNVTVDGAEPEKKLALDKDGNVVGVLKAVAPYEMGKSLHIVVTYSGVKVKEFDYSILKYCNAVYNAQGYGKGSSLGKLCTGLINYGKWAEDYYNEVNHISAEPSDVNAAEVIDFSGNSIFGSYTAPSDEFKASDTVSYAAGSLTLGSTVSLNFYVFTKKELSADNILIRNNLGETVNTKNITVEETYDDTYGSGYIIKVNNIGASKLSRVYTLTINGVAENVFKIVYGVESYCYNVQSATGDVYTPTLKTLCKAIFNYAEVAKAYAAK